MKNMPVFVRVERPREVFDVISVIETKIQDARTIFNKIMDLMEKEDEEIKEWKSKIQMVKSRFEYLDGELKKV